MSKIEKNIFKIVSDFAPYLQKRTTFYYESIYTLLNEYIYLIRGMFISYHRCIYIIGQKNV